MAFLWQWLVDTVTAATLDLVLSHLPHRDALRQGKETCYFMVGILRHVDKEILDWEGERKTNGGRRCHC